MNTEACIALIQGVFTIVAALLTAWFALSLYHRQKEYELVKQRYLDGSVDVLASEIENSLGVFNHNWARCLNILKTYRDAGELFDIKDLDTGFIEYESVHFNQIAHYRLHSLTNTYVYWNIYQKTLAFVTNSVSLMQHEIPDVIKAKITTDAIDSDQSAIVDDAFERLKKLQKESHKFSFLSNELQTIATLLEQEKLSLKNIKVFKDKPEITKSIDNMNTIFKDELAEPDDEDA